MPRKRKRAPLPLPPRRSSRCYVRMAQSDTRLFRYLLDGYDNLAYSTVIDRTACILRVGYSVHQEEEIKRVLQDMQNSVQFEILPV